MDRIAVACTHPYIFRVAHRSLHKLPLPPSLLSPTSHLYIYLLPLNKENRRKATIYIRTSSLIAIPCSLLPVTGRNNDLYTEAITMSLANDKQWVCSTSIFNRLLLSASLTYAIGCEIYP